jgi:lipoprotein-anchoring transpeptidase ErfK/SrfK
MLYRALLVLTCFPLTACTTVVSETPQLADLGKAIVSYAHALADAREDLTGTNSKARPKRLSREFTAYHGDEPPGTIVVRMKERRLYLVLADKKAISYPVGVGRAGKQWQGRAEIDGAFVEPAWSPTAEIKRDNPDVPDRIPGGARNNPMGARALTLSGGKYAIHGTNRPETIGTDATYGCIRMFNEDVIDLYDRARVGTKVVVIRG